VSLKRHSARPIVQKGIISAQKVCWKQRCRTHARTIVSTQEPNEVAQVFNHNLVSRLRPKRSSSGRCDHDPRLLGMAMGTGSSSTARRLPPTARWTVRPYGQRKTDARNEVTTPVRSVWSITEQGDVPHRRHGEWWDGPRSECLGQCPGSADVDHGNSRSIQQGVHTS
jgi:hypothetical protein